VESGDGCNYGEGGNHYLAAIRRNPDITCLVHNNQVYGLTKGQASPTSDEGFVTKAQPEGPTAAPFNPLAVAVAMRAGFVARSFAGMIEHLAGVIKEAISFRGFALVDILQPCISFNHVNTFAWYRERCRELPKDYDPTNWELAMKTSEVWGDTIPVGVIYRNPKPVFREHFAVLAKGGLVGRETDYAALAEIINSYE
jgi:2-oxoglutarate ferredoxin oxidoreductase subunit beta